VESAIEIVDPSIDLQIVSIGDANSGIQPRPNRRTTFAEWQISQIKDKPLAIRTIGERICGIKPGICGTTQSCLTWPTS